MVVVGPCQDRYVLDIYPVPDTTPVNKTCPRCQPCSQVARRPGCIPVNDAHNDYATHSRTTTVLRLLVNLSHKLFRRFDASVYVYAIQRCYSSTLPLRLRLCRQRRCHQQLKAPVHVIIPTTTDTTIAIHNSGTLIYLSSYIPVGDTRYFLDYAVTVVTLELNVHVCEEIVAMEQFHRFRFLTWNICNVFTEFVFHNRYRR